MTILIRDEEAEDTEAYEQSLRAWLEGVDGVYVIDVEIQEV